MQGRTDEASGKRHPVTQWRTQGAIYMNAQPAQPDGSRVAPFSGALAAYTCFAYDLYIGDNNGELDDALVQRLKNPEHFQGARHKPLLRQPAYERVARYNTRMKKTVVAVTRSSQSTTLPPDNFSPSRQKASIARECWADREARRKARLTVRRTHQ